VCVCVEREREREIKREGGSGGDIERPVQFVRWVCD